MVTTESALILAPVMSPETFASTLPFGGDKDETMKYLQQPRRNHDPDLIFIQNEPLFNFLHSDPRYQAIVTKWGCGQRTKGSSD